MLIPKNNIRNLILLFFPTLADYENRVLTGKSLYIHASIAASVTAQSQPEIPPFIYKNNYYNRRRPGFLDNLSNSEYTQVFLYIATKQPIFDLQKRWGMLQNNITIITSIISHLLVWFDTNQTFPEKAAKERQSFQWDTIVRDIILRQSMLVEGGKHGFDKNTDNLEVACSLIWKIWDAVDLDKIQKDAVVRKEVGNLFTYKLLYFTDCFRFWMELLRPSDQKQLLHCLKIIKIASITHTGQIYCLRLSNKQGQLLMVIQQYITTRQKE